MTVFKFHDLQPHFIFDILKSGFEYSVYRNCIFLKASCMFWPIFVFVFFLYLTKEAYILRESLLYF